MKSKHEISLYKPGLCIRNLIAGYGNLTVIHGISFDIQPGETVGLVGANGSGKSTVLNAIMGITWARANDFILDGLCLKGLNILQRQSAGLTIALQRGAVFRDLTIADNLKLANMSTCDLEEMFQTEALSKIAMRLIFNKNQITGTLSGGEQRLLGVAMALSQACSLLLVDEPSIGLEPQAALEMLQYITDIPKRRARTGVLVISHDYITLTCLCDRLHVLKHGSMYHTWDRAYLVSDPEAIIEAIKGKD